MAKKRITNIIFIYCIDGWIILAKVCGMVFKNLDLNNIIPLPIAS
jgi:hypothetical protein